MDHNEDVDIRIIKFKGERFILYWSKINPNILQLPVYYDTYRNIIITTYRY